MTSNVCNTTLEEEIIEDETRLIGAMTAHGFLGLVAGACTIVATVLTFFLVFMHLTHYTVPRQQRYIIRILFMVPLYSLATLGSIRWYQYAIYFSTISAIYEPFVISGFFALLYNYVGKDFDAQMEYFKNLTFLYKYKIRNPNAKEATAKDKKKTKVESDTSRYDFDRAISELWNGWDAGKDEHGNLRSTNLGLIHRLQVEIDRYNEGSKLRCRKQDSHKGFTKEELVDKFVREARDQGEIRPWAPPLTFGIAWPGFLSRIGCFPALRDWKKEIWSTDVPLYGDTWFNLNFVGCYQYCFFRVLCTFVAVFAQLAGTLCASSMSMVFWNIRVVIVTSLSVTLTMLCVIQFYDQTKEVLKEHAPLAKLIAIKLVIFLTFFQAIIISTFVNLKVFSPSEGIRYPDWAVSIPAALLCFEMAIFAIMHVFVYSYEEYTMPGDTERETGLPKRGRFRALIHALNPMDFWHAFWSTVSWLIHWRFNKEAKGRKGVFEAAILAFVEKNGLFTRKSSGTLCFKGKGEPIPENMQNWKPAERTVSQETSEPPPRYKRYPSDYSGSADSENTQEFLERFNEEQGSSAPPLPLPSPLEEPDRLSPLSQPRPKQHVDRSATSPLEQRTGLTAHHPLPKPRGPNRSAILFPPPRYKENELEFTGAHPLPSLVTASPNSKKWPTARRADTAFTAPTEASSSSRRAPSTAPSKVSRAGTSSTAPTEYTSVTAPGLPRQPKRAYTESSKSNDADPFPEHQTRAVNKNSLNRPGRPALGPRSKSSGFGGFNQGASSSRDVSPLGAPGRSNTGNGVRGAYPDLRKYARGQTQEPNIYDEDYFTSHQTQSRPGHGQNTYTEEEIISMLDQKDNRKAFLKDPNERRRLNIPNNIWFCALERRPNFAEAWFENVLNTPSRREMEGLSNRHNPHVWTETLSRLPKRLKEKYDEKVILEQEFRAHEGFGERSAWEQKLQGDKEIKSKYDWYLVTEVRFREEEGLASKRDWLGRLWMDTGLQWVLSEFGRAEEVEVWQRFERGMKRSLGGR